MKTQFRYMIFYYYLTNINFITIIDLAEFL